MELKCILQLGIIFTIVTGTAISANGAKRVILRPLSAKEVVKVLKLAGREDAIPEGRVVTQGLAAIGGFVLGLTKGVGGSILFDLATSNATSQFINNFNASAFMGDLQGINMTALTQMFKWDFANNSVATRYQTYEICFKTRVDDPVAEEATNTDTIDGTGTDDGTATYSESVTQTDEDSGQTCIVLQKPIQRKRRSLHRRRRR